MKKLFVAIIAVLLVLGCGKNLPNENDNLQPQGGTKDLSIICTGQKVESPKFGSNIKSNWDMVVMTVKNDTTAEVTVTQVARGKTYRVNVEFAPNEWAADVSGIRGKLVVNGKEITNTENNGQGGKNFLLTVE